MQLLCERALIGEAPAETVRRQLIHRLALVESSTHSELSSALPRRLVEHASFPETLKGVAEYLEPSGMRQGRYTLRREGWRGFDPFFSLYSVQEAQRANERSGRFAAEVGAAPPTPARPCAVFERLGGSARSTTLHALVYLVLAGAVRRSKRVSERLLASALRLLQLSIGARLELAEAAAEVEAGASAAARAEAPLPRAFGIQMPSDAAEISEDALLPPTALGNAFDSAGGVAAGLGGVEGAEEGGARARPELPTMITLLATLRDMEHFGAQRVAVEESLRRLARLSAPCRTRIESLIPELRTAEGGEEGSSNQKRAEMLRRKKAAKERQVHATSHTPFVTAHFLLFPPLSLGALHHVCSRSSHFPVCPCIAPSLFASNSRRPY